MILYYEPCPTVIIDSGRRVAKVLGGDSLTLATGPTLKHDATLLDLAASLGPPAGRLRADETWYYPGLRVMVRFSKRGICYCLGEDPPGPLRPVGLHQDPWTLTALRLERDVLLSAVREFDDLDPGVVSQMIGLGQKANALLQDHAATQEQVVDGLQRCTTFWQELLISLGGQGPGRKD